MGTLVQDGAQLFYSSKSINAQVVGVATHDGDPRLTLWKHPLLQNEGALQSQKYGFIVQSKRGVCAQALRQPFIPPVHQGNTDVAVKMCIFSVATHTSCLLCSSEVCVHTKLAMEADQLGKTSQVRLKGFEAPARWFFTRIHVEEYRERSRDPLTSSQNGVFGLDRDLYGVNEPDVLTSTTILQGATRKPELDSAPLAHSVCMLCSLSAGTVLGHEVAVQHATHSNGQPVPNEHRQTATRH